VRINAPPVRHTEIIERMMRLGVFDSYMLSLHQTQSGMRLFTNSPDAEKIIDELRDLKVEIRAGYAELHLRLPSSMDGVEGVLTMMVDVLSQNGVHVVGADEGDGEVRLVLREDDAGRAFDALRALSK
jgi:aspartokinase